MVAAASVVLSGSTALTSVSATATADPPDAYSAAKSLPGAPLELSASRSIPGGSFTVVMVIVLVAALLRLLLAAPSSTCQVMVRLVWGAELAGVGLGEEKLIALRRVWLMARL